MRQSSGLRSAVSSPGSTSGRGSRGAVVARTEKETKGRERTGTERDAGLARGPAAGISPGSGARGAVPGESLGETVAERVSTTEKEKETSSEIETTTGRETGSTTERETVTMTGSEIVTTTGREIASLNGTEIETTIETGTAISTGKGTATGRGRRKRAEIERKRGIESESDSERGRGSVSSTTAVRAGSVPKRNVPLPKNLHLREEGAVLSKSELCFSFIFADFLVSSRYCYTAVAIYCLFVFFLLWYIQSLLFFCKVFGIWIFSWYCFIIANNVFFWFLLIQYYNLNSYFHFPYSEITLIWICWNVDIEILYLRYINVINTTNLYGSVTVHLIFIFNLTD